MVTMITATATAIARLGPSTPPTIATSVLDRPVAVPVTKEVYIMHIHDNRQHAQGVDMGLFMGRALYRFVLITHAQTLDHAHIQHLTMVNG